MKKAIRNLTLTLAGALLFVPFAQGAVSTAQKKDGLSGLENQVRHELVMLPWFGVFDNLEFQVNGDEVVLSGHVTRPTLKTDAGRVVTRIEGVTKVVNNIEVLPLSSLDDQIRLATYRSIYSFGALSRYNWGPVPPIHLIVKNGNVTLAGVVATETDRNIAALRANGVSGVFSVDNNLKVEGRS
jgi:hyperosmotically inducible periplasmic protein